MKSLPIALSALLIVALPAWGTAAKAGVPIEVSAPAGDDPPNQVLELPQSCSSEDGTENPCPPKDPTTASTDPAGPDGALRDDATVGDTDSSVAAAPVPAPLDADGSVAAASAQAPDPGAVAENPINVGTAQDYQAQAQVDNTAALPNYGYPQTDPTLRMPTILVAPVAVGPVVGTAPYVPPILPASGPIIMPMPRGPMFYAIRPITPLITARPMVAARPMYGARPMLSAPMSATGMPGAFRVH